MLLVSTAGVALEGELVADEDPARLAGLNVIVVLVHDADDCAARRPAGRAGGGAHVLGGRDRGPGDLGGAVEVVEVVPELVHPRRGELAWKRGAARRRHLEGGEVVAALDFLREAEDPLHHHRYDGKDPG